MMAATLVQNGILAPAAAATTLAETASGPPAAATAVARSATQATPAATTSTRTAPPATPHPFIPAPAHHAATAHVAAPAGFGKTQNPAGAVGGTVFALVFVLGLIFALAWLAKRMPGVGGGSNRALRVVTSLSLAPREKVVVVDVGGTQLLLGVGSGGTRMLHTLATPLPEAERPATPPFAQLLAQHFGKKA